MWREMVTLWIQIFTPTVNPRHPLWSPKLRQPIQMNRLIKSELIFNPFNTTDHFSLIQNNDWKSPLKLLSVERVNHFLTLSKSTASTSGRDKNWTAPLVGTG